MPAEVSGTNRKPVLRGIGRLGRNFEPMLAETLSLGRNFEPR
jgi:hypothetical protein